jgi:predicted  nucleic acid-binding Zn-ribbon protein
MSFTPLWMFCECGIQYAYVNSEDLRGCPDCRNRPKGKRR